MSNSIKPFSDSGQSFLGSFEINMSDGFIPSFGIIDLYPTKVVITPMSKAIYRTSDSSPKIIFLQDIRKINIVLNGLLNYKIVVHYINENINCTLRFSCGVSLSVNLYNTVYLYQALLELLQTGECKLSQLKKGFIADRIPVLFIFTGIFIFLFIPLILYNVFNIQLHVLQDSIDKFISIAPYVPIPLIFIPMFIGGGLFGIPIGLVYIYKVHKIIVEINRKYQPNN